MKTKMLFVILFGMVVPVSVMAWLSYQSGPALEPLPTREPTRPTEPVLPVLTADGVKELTWDAYLTGVVLAEMPADFHPEALKAQTVVAHTYAQKRLEGDKHGGPVCTEPACCQGYRSETAYLAAGGTQESVDKVRQAVAAAAEQVLTYDGVLIDATYFSCSGGATEAAVAVWGTDVPYLQSVESPGEEAAYNVGQASFSAKELSNLLEISNVTLGAVTYTQGGGVDTIVIGGETFTGKELRTRLGLRSTAFEAEQTETGITFHTRGYGHRVGMSQYGAQAMAKGGADYTAILSHYYPGTQLQNAAP